jgi:hypothetical protein
LIGCMVVAEEYTLAETVDGYAQME